MIDLNFNDSGDVITAIWLDGWLNTLANDKCSIIFNYRLCTFLYRSQNFQRHSTEYMSSSILLYIFIQWIEIYFVSVKIYLTIVLLYKPLNFTVNRRARCSFVHNLRRRRYHSTCSYYEIELLECAEEANTHKQYLHTNTHVQSKI